MNIKLVVGVLAIGSLAISGVANAVTLDPTVEENYFFQWDDVGPVDRVYDWDGVTEYTDSTVPSWSESIGSDWEITVGSDSTIDFVTAWDSFLVGDEFELVLDGAQIDWTSSYDDTDGFFHGVYDDLFLSAGTHTLTFNVTESLPGGGGGYATFGAVSPATSVPEPGSLAMLGLGLAGLGFARKKRA